MSQKELQRVSVISACLKRDLACASAAELLSLSVRHIKRLKKRLREAGEAARLALGALASLAAGAAARAVAPSSTRALWALGGILLAVFIPTHIGLWAKFPVWYHLTFLGSLVPLVLLGAAFTGNRSRIASS